MNGQWIGALDGGGIKGTVVVDVDETAKGYRGRITTFEESGALPPLLGMFDIASKGNPAIFQMRIVAADPATMVIMQWDEVVRKYPDRVIPRNIQITLAWDDENLTLDWESALKGGGRTIFPRSAAGRQSEYQKNVISWGQFKDIVTHLEPRQFVFRGQRKPQRLRSTYHRTGRANLVDYTAFDIPALHQHISGRTRHLFSLADRLEYGAFLHLCQHHGYPTPLLDWSYSPFVAAFFAFRSIRNSEASAASDDDCVRIFKFNKAEWQKMYASESTVDGLRMHLSFFEFLAVDNERMIPQQALSSLTNIDDVEKYIRMRERQNEKTYIEVFDLPVKDRQSIMNELSMMGITAGALFPGLDGSCEELRERFFSS